jgi:hypothetical protein
MISMIDYKVRSDVRRTVEDYLSDCATAFDFDEQLSEIRDRTDDATVQFVIDQLWLVYDDCQDHLVCLDKGSWDTIQRLMLVLDSGAVVSAHRQWKLHASQVVAALTLLAIVVVCSWEPGAWAIPVLVGGVVSVLLGTWRGRAWAALEPADPWRAWPFPSLSALHTALKRAPQFRKWRHRREVASRQIRAAAESRCMTLHYLFTWCLISPVALLAQCMPLRFLRAQVEEQRTLADAAA